MKKIKVLTQNVYGPFIYRIYSRLDFVKKTIDLHSCDLVSLQEVIFFSYLKNLNKNYYRIYKNGRIGPRGGLVILSKTKPDSVEFYKFEEQGAWFNRQLTDRIIEKGFLVARFGLLTYINTHLLTPNGKKEGHKNHRYLKRQFNQLLYFLRNEKKNGQEIILTGDLNFSDGFSCYKNLATFLQDHTYEIKDVLKTEKRSGNVDYIWSSFSFFGENTSKVEYPCFVSDHPGVLVEIGVEKDLKPLIFS